MVLTRSHYSFVLIVFILLAGMVLCPSSLLWTGYLIKAYPYLGFVFFAAAVYFLEQVPILFVCLFAFSYSLYGSWYMGLTDASAVGTLFPMNDASSYFAEARFLLDGYPLSSGASRRPGFIGLLASILWLTHDNLKFALVMLSLIASVTTYFLIRRTESMGGKKIASLSAGLLFTFYNRFNGTVLTEQLGFCLGCFAMFFLIEACKTKKLASLFAGCFFMALALNVRAGAFFILPMLVLWASLFLNGSLKWDFKFAITAVMGIVFAFCLNAVLVRMIGSPAGVPFGNFAQTLYGIVTGGNGWWYVMSVHPELQHVHDPELTKIILEFAWSKFLENPFLILKAIYHSYLDYFSPSGYGAYGFFFWDRSTIIKGWGIERAANVFFRSVFLLLTVNGLWIAIKQRKQPLFSCFLLIGLGVFLSIPWIPPIDADQGRIYAANVPWLCLLTAMGLGFGKTKAYISKNEIRIGLLFSSMIVFLTFVFPLVLKKSISPQKISRSSCPIPQHSVAARAGIISSIQLVEDSETSPFSVFSGEYIVSQRNFASHLETLRGNYGIMVKYFESLKPGSAILYLVDSTRAKEFWFLTSRDELIKLRNKADWMHFCLEPNHNPSIFVQNAVVFERLEKIE